MTGKGLNLSALPGPAALLGLMALYIVAFFPAIVNLVQSWLQSDDHSHGLLVLPVSLYIIRKNFAKIKAVEVDAGRLGLLFVTLSICLYFFGSITRVSTLVSLSMVFTLWAMVWSLFGQAVFRAILFPMLLLLLMIPVPAQFYAMATVPLQLMVSKASASIAGSLGIPIFREGNVLHLPGHTLAVVQACSGIRSLMSLVTLSAIFGYLTLTSKILQGVLVVSSIPAAIIVNIIRVVMMIVSFQYFDLDLSVGTVHTLFGVVIFVLTLLIVAIVRGGLSKWDIKPTSG